MRVIAHDGLVTRAFVADHVDLFVMNVEAHAVWKSCVELLDRAAARLPPREPEAVIFDLRERLIDLPPSRNFCSSGNRGVRDSPSIRYQVIHRCVHDLAMTQAATFDP